MRKNMIYKKENYSIKTYNIIASDIENNPDTGVFICAGIYGKIGDNIIEKYFENIQEYNDYLLKFDDTNNIIIFYNLNYDEFAIRDIVDDSKILRNQSRIIKINLENGAIYDIQNISGIEYSLEKWIDYLNLKEKYGIEKVDFTDIKLRVMNDTKATWYLGDFIQKYFNDTWKIELKPTIGSCALEIFKCNFLKYDITRTLLNEDIDIVPKIERDSLRGGRCEIFLRGNLNIISYDVRSMYVSIMRDNPVPIPDKYKLLLTENELNNYREYFINYLSILDVTVQISQQKIMPLPCYAKVNNVNKIIYPCGIFRGVYTNVELLNAEKYGLKILKVHKMIYYYKSDYLFKDFALSIWNIREKYNKKCLYNCSKCFYDNDNMKNCYFSKKNPYYNKAVDTLTKKIGNSLFGKFSQHVPLISYYGRERQLPEEYKQFLNDEKYSIGIYEYFGEQYIDIHSKEKIDAKFCFCCISAFITSYARIYLLNTMKKNEDMVAYCDTDSIKILNENGNYIDNGKNLGDFMYEYARKEKFFAPKFYGSKTKGVSKTEREILEDNVNNGYIVFSYKKPFKFKSAIRQNKAISSWEKVEKKIELYDDKRLWSGNIFYNSGIYSKPYYINTGDNIKIIVNS